MTAHDQKAEYMSNVKWTTALYVAVSTCSIILAIAGVYWGLKGDIKDTRIESKEQITSVATMLNRKMDSLQHINDIQFLKINNQLGMPPITERKVGDKIILQPVK